MVHPDASLTVKAPVNVSNQKINQFLNDKAKWIKEKIAHYQGIQAEKEKIISLQNVEILGEPFEIEYAKIKQPEILMHSVILP